METHGKNTCGTLDNGNPEEQMAAIDKAMHVYFDAEDWIVARAKQFPGLKLT